MSDWKIKLDAELNTKNINSQIETLKKQLSNSKVITDIDTKSLIEKLNNLQVNLNNVNVSDQSINNMVSQINNALKNINVQISNMDTTKIVNQSRQVGQQIGQNIQNGINSSTSSKSINVIEQIKRSLNEINTKGNKLGFTINDKEIESVANKIKNVVKQIDTLNVKQSNNGKITISTTGLDKFGSKIKLTQTAIKDLESDTLKFTEAISSISDNGISKQFERISSKADSLSTKLEKLKSSYSDMNSSRPIKDGNNLASLESQYNRILESIQNVRNADNSTFSSMVSNAEKEISVLESMISQFRNAENVATKMKSTDFSSGLEIARNNLAKFKTEASNFSQMNNTVRELESSIAKVGDASSLNKFTDQLRVAKSELQAVKKESSQFVNEQRRLSMANTIEAWNQKNTAASKTAIQANEQYIASLRDLNTQMSKVQFNNIQTSFKQTENAMRGMSKLGLALKDQWKQAVSSFSIWLSASTAVMKVISETREAFGELREIDTLLTEISKTNWNLTSNDLENIGSNSFGVASKYGKTATDYLSGVKDMSRAGYTNSEAMAELSVAAQGAGDMTAEVANKMVIATDKAYKMNGSVEQLTKTLDGVNWICDNNAVNMTELSEGMSIVASTAASMGVDVDQLTAALGTMASVTQQSGSEVARAFKAILLNVKQVSDADENIDADGLTKYEKACNALGVTLKETKNGVLQTRDAMDVLEDLSKSYSMLDANDIRRTNLLNSVGGKSLPRYIEIYN